MMKKALLAIAGVALLTLSGGGAAVAQTRPLTSEIGKAGTPPSPEVMARGQAIMEDLGWPSHFGPYDKAFKDLTVENIFNGVYGRPGLTPKERELVIMTAIIASGTGSLYPHVSHAAPRTGVSEENIREVIYTTCFYAGWPRCASAQHNFQEYFKEARKTWPKELLMSGQPDGEAQPAAPAAPRK